MMYVWDGAEVGDVALLRLSFVNFVDLQQPL